MARRECIAPHMGIPWLCRQVITIQNWRTGHLARDRIPVVNDVDHDSLPCRRRRRRGHHGQNGLNFCFNVDREVSLLLELVSLSFSIFLPLEGTLFL